MSKIEKFVKEFNLDLKEDMDRFLGLEVIDNGFAKAIKLPEIYLWDDDNNSDEFVEQICLAELQVNLSELLSVTEKRLEERITEFLLRKKKEILDKFEKAKFKIGHIGNGWANVFISGKYNEDIMYDFVEQLEENFHHIFPGIKISVEY